MDLPVPVSRESEGTQTVMGGRVGDETAENVHGGDDSDAIVRQEVRPLFLRCADVGTEG